MKLQRKETERVQKNLDDTAERASMSKWKSDQQSDPYRNATREQLDQRAQSSSDCSKEQR
jgi:heme-degrading monooxygenase HmoA